VPEVAVWSLFRSVGGYFRRVNYIQPCVKFNLGIVSFSASDRSRSADVRVIFYETSGRDVLQGMYAR
jgi:hypothetical protein